MNHFTNAHRTSIAIAAAALLSANATAFDGSEKLDVPVGIEMANAGSEVLLAGVGMKDKFERILKLDVPAGVEIKQVIAYWEGQGLSQTEHGDMDKILLNGIEVTGKRIGGATNFFFSRWTSTYRADVTGLDLIGHGANEVKVRGLNFKGISNGLGLAVIIDDGQNTGTVDMRDGNDNAMIGFESPLDTTTPVSYSFAPSTEDRTASLGYFFGSIAKERPTVIEISIDNQVAETINDALTNSDGDEWDTYKHDVVIPAGATSLSIRVLSMDSGLGAYKGNNPASLTWVFNSFALPKAKSNDLGCTPLFWCKNRRLWDGVGNDDVTTRIKTRTYFNRTLGVNACKSRVRNCTPMYMVLCKSRICSWTDLLNREVVAALLNAESPLPYRYTVAQVIAIYRDAVGATNGPETVKSAIAKFRAASKAACGDNRCDRRKNSCSKKRRSSRCRSSRSRRSYRRCR